MHRRCTRNATAIVMRHFYQRAPKVWHRHAATHLVNFVNWYPLNGKKTLKRFWKLPLWLYYFKHMDEINSEYEIIFATEKTKTFGDKISVLQGLCWQRACHIEKLWKEIQKEMCNIGGKEAGVYIPNSLRNKPIDVNPWLIYSGINTAWSNAKWRL